MFSSNTTHSGLVNYIEDVFSTYLYTGTGATQTITNGIDLSGKGGLVWVKQRNGTYPNVLSDSAQGFQKGLVSNSTAAVDAVTNGVTYSAGSATSTGLILGANTESNGTGGTFASWTFRKQPKFFDIVTYTGNGTSQNIAHNLGSVPGCIIVKRTDSVGNWSVWHKDSSTLYLDSIAAVGTNIFGSVTSTTFNIITGINYINASGGSYVAYVFAHNAGGFGLTGQDNVISCGTFSGPGLPVVNLGYEPQFIMTKRVDSTGNWVIYDTMRGLNGTFNQYSDYVLNPNTSDTEIGLGDMYITSTGFVPGTIFAGSQYIYIAIRRGPMRVPTDATKVFVPVAYTGNGATRTITSNFPVDMFICSDRDNTSGLVGYKQALFDRVLGNANGFRTATSGAWGGGWGDTYFNFANSAGITLTGSFIYLNNSTTPYVNWTFQRAPSFFDIVTYAGTGVATTVTHSLGVVPELIIVKSVSSAEGWAVYAAPLGITKYLSLNSISGALTDPSSVLWNGIAPTSTVFSIGTTGGINTSGNKYAAYLFATCAGVSKVGSYTGTATTQQVNCGFTSGARFVLIKRTDSTSDWYIWDTARSIVTGNDPYLLLNSQVAEVTTTDYIDPYSPGFEISSTAPAAINASGGTYIFLAIA